MSGIDFNVITREEFSEKFNALSVPDGASERYSKLFKALQKLLDILIKHDAMVTTGNSKQTYNTPALSKNGVYFMWDFVGRTLGMLQAIDPKLPPSSRKAWGDVVGRSSMIHMLVNNKSMLDMMTQQMHGGGADSNWEWGDEVTQATEEVKAAAR